MGYRLYTDQDVIDAAAEVTTLAQLLQKLDLRPAGGNYANMKRILQRLQVDTNHWLGQAWNKDKQLKDWSSYKDGTNLKKHLITKKGHSCEQYGLSEWLNEPITLELHHDDGDRTNNVEENLILLCPNCHSFTETWRGRNK